MAYTLSKRELKMTMNYAKEGLLKNGIRDTKEGKEKCM